MTAVRTPDLPAHGNCYQDAFNALLELGGGWRLVHGRPILTRPPYCQFGHAWVECGGVVIDPKGCVPRDLYYKIGRIDEGLNIYYCLDDACRMAVMHGHYGPWEGVDASSGHQGRSV